MKPLLSGNIFHTANVGIGSNNPQAAQQQ